MNHMSETNTFNKTLSNQSHFCVRALWTSHKRGFTSLDQHCLKQIFSTRPYRISLIFAFMPIQTSHKRGFTSLDQHFHKQ